MVSCTKLFRDTKHPQAKQWDGPPTPTSGYTHGRPAVLSPQKSQGHNKELFFVPSSPVHFALKAHRASVWRSASACALSQHSRCHGNRYCGEACWLHHLSELLGRRPNFGFHERHWAGKSWASRQLLQSAQAQGTLSAFGGFSPQARRKLADPSKTFAPDISVQSDVHGRSHSQVGRDVSVKCVGLGALPWLLGSKPIAGRGLVHLRSRSQSQASSVRGRERSVRLESRPDAPAAPPDARARRPQLRRRARSGRGARPRGGTRQQQQRACREGGRATSKGGERGAAAAHDHAPRPRRGVPRTHACLPAHMQPRACRRGASGPRRAFPQEHARAAPRRAWRPAVRRPGPAGARQLPPACHAPRGQGGGGRERGGLQRPGGILAYVKILGRSLSGNGRPGPGTDGRGPEQESDPSSSTAGRATATCGPLAAGPPCAPPASAPSVRCGTAVLPS
eukprot:scaffold1811_cov411-Prasinococcus_capsulatus_cf.AAC.14